jgi:hypothetical protein
VFPPDFDVTEPRITDNINTKGNAVTGSRIFEYVIIPRNEGNFTIPPAVFTFFNPQNGTYKTLATEEFTLQIEKGAGQLSVSTTSSQKDIKVLGNDIRYIRTSNFKLRPVGVVFFGSLQYYAALLLPILLLLIFIIIWRKQIETRSNIALMRNKRANKVARKNLKTAKKMLDEKNKEQFYMEISRALWGYLSSKYHIPVSQLSMENVATKLMQLGVPTQTTDSFLETLQQCEFARFAPGDSSEIMNEMFQKANDFILQNETQRVVIL